jgi:hypothetical protein
VTVARRRRLVVHESRGASSAHCKCRCCDLSTWTGTDDREEIPPPPCANASGWKTSGGDPRLWARRLWEACGSTICDDGHRLLRRLKSDRLLRADRRNVQQAEQAPGMAMVSSVHWRASVRRGPRTTPVASASRPDGPLGSDDRSHPWRCETKRGSASRPASGSTFGLILEPEAPGRPRSGARSSPSPRASRLVGFVVVPGWTTSSLESTQHLAGRSPSLGRRRLRDRALSF